jgi:hypothetical protein
VLYDNCYIRRVRCTPNGRHYIKYSSDVIFLNPDGTTVNGRYKWVPLTFEFPEDEKATKVAN